MFAGLEPFLLALRDDRREDAWAIWTALLPNLTAAQAELVEWGRRIEARRRGVAATKLVTDLVLLAVDAVGAIRGLRGLPRFPRLPPGPPTAAAVAVVAAPLGYTDTVAEVLRGSAVAMAVIGGGGGRGTGGTIGRQPPRTPRPPIVFDQRVPGFWRTAFHRLARRYPNLRQVILRAIARGPGAGAFEERFLAGNMPFSVDAEMPPGVWNEGRSRTVQIDGFTDLWECIEVRIRSTFDDTEIDRAVDVVEQLARSERSAGSAAAFREVREAALRRELRKRATFIRFTGLPRWRYITQNAEYAKMVRRLVKELRLQREIAVDLIDL
jgi:hypothetical protein